MTLAELFDTYAKGRKALDDVDSGLAGIGIAMAPQIALGLLILREVGQPVKLSAWHAAAPLGKTASYAAGFLTEHGFARRLESTDKRQRPIEITDAGRALVARLEAHLAGGRMDVAA